MFMVRLIATVATVLSTINFAAAQDWPVRPITMVYPFAAGSAADTLGRTLASRMSESLGQSVVFENVSGAGGMTGSNRVAKAAPDGYQLLLGGTFIVLNQWIYKNPLYDAATDIVPVVLLVEQPILLVARKDLPAGNLAEFIAFAKANQGKMQYGSTGAGSAPHLACELFNRRIGVSITHVPYRGGVAQLQDVIAGRLDYSCLFPPTAAPHIESGALKGIAIFSRERLRILPRLETAHEQGLPDFEVKPWYAFFLPKGTPSAIIQKIRQAAVAAMDTPAIQERLQAAGYSLAPSENRSSEFLQRLVEKDMAKWGVVIKEAGLTAE
jgi:tripartite-type tricarboxylate transporter receptor subunit TctC